MKNSIKSEFYKLLYHRWWKLSVLALGLFYPAMLWVFLEQGLAPLDALLQSFYLGQCGFVLLAALYMGEEFQNASLRSSLLAQPKRGRLLFAKGLAFFLWASVLFLLYSLLSVLLISLFSEAPLSLAGLLELTQPLLVVYAATLSLAFLSFATTSIFGGLLPALALWLSMILGLGQLLLQFSQYSKYLPVLSSMQVYFSKAQEMYLPFGQGLALQGFWAVLGLAVAYYCMKHKAVR